MTRPAPRRSRLAGSSPVAPPAHQDAEQPATVGRAPGLVEEPQHAQQQATNGPAKASAPNSPAPARKTATAAAGATARLGIYLTPQEFNDGKAAYLTDWSNGGQADTFARWIAAALDTYAARTPKQRAGAAPRGRAEERTGSTRSFSIPTDTVARMRAAITADQQAGRWPSDSAWCGEAIAAAVDQARVQNGGSLATPPPRLPNRLVR
jgi:hypothetical protein